MKSENLRYHAAGHLAAAVLLLNTGQDDAAKTILGTVSAFANSPQVNAPPQLKNKILDNIANPKADDIALLEQWFVDPLNTTIEASGGKF